MGEDFQTAGYREALTMGLKQVELASLPGVHEMTIDH